MSRGKSISTRTYLSLTPFLKASWEKTSLLSFMHQLHQSDPVKSTSRVLCSAAAFFLAAVKSVIHPSPAAKEHAVVSASAMAANFVVFFIR